MAKYHMHLKYHDDVTEKHNISKEDIEFLTSLQTEMNTQDNVGQADPIFWVIKGTQKEYGFDSGYEDGSDLINEYDTVACNMKEALEYIKENLIEEINDCDGVIRTLELRVNPFGNYDTIRISWSEDEEEDYKILHDMDDVIEWLEEHGYDNYRCANYRNTEKIYANTMFLTQKAAEKHLKANHYHYSEDAHTYAMTSWRCRETEALWKILRSINWEDLSN